MKKVLLAFGIVSLIISCYDKGDKEVNSSLSQVRQMTSPASDSCAEPFLFTDKNGMTYLSWIEKNGKQNTLYFSTLSNEKWSERIKIASGNNWFVNWADYPVISGDGDKNLMAHFLE